MIDAIVTLLQGFGLEPAVFFGTVFVSSIIFILAFRKFFLNIFDPLTLFVVDMVACTTLVFTFGIENNLKIEFVVFVFFFWLGFRRFPLPEKQGIFQLTDTSLFELEAVLVVLFALLVIGNLYIGATSGFPIFSANPTQAKVDEFTGGAGIIRRLNGLPYVFFAAGCIVLALLRRRRWFFSLLLMIGTLAVVLAGSKGALVPLMFILSYAANRRGLVEYFRGGKKRIMRYAAIALAFGVVVALFVAGRDAGGGWQVGMVGLLSRVIMSGDVVFYYYPSHGTNPALAGLGPADYIFYLFTGILGEFRLISYPEALGTLIMGSGGKTGFGPNAQYFVRADIFFGPIFGCLYCFVIGYLTGWMRKQFFTFSGTSAFKLVLSLTIATSAFVLSGESQYFVSQLFDLAMLLIPIWVAARIIAIAIASPQPQSLDVA